MSRKIDVEMRVSFTGRENGTIDWSVVLVEPDGQCRFDDEGTYRRRQHDPLEDEELARAIVRGTNSCLWSALQAQF